MRPFLLALLLPLLFSTSAAAKLKVTATLPSLAAIAKEVAGEHADVEALTGPHQDPHYVDPRPSLVLHLARADFLLVNGLELEHAWIEPLMAQSRNPKINLGGQGYFDASAFVTKLEIPVRLDRSMGDVHPGGNPHFLFDPRRAADVAKALGQRFAAADPEHADEYRKNAARLSDELGAFAKEQAERFRALPQKKRHVVSYHQSLTYLYDWLGLLRVATIEPRPGIPPDPSHVAKVLKAMKSNHVDAIVQEEFYPANVSKTLAELGKAQLVVIRGGARVKEGQSYLAHLREITEALYAALSD